MYPAVLSSLVQWLRSWAPNPRVVSLIPPERFCYYFEQVTLSLAYLAVNKDVASVGVTKRGKNIHPIDSTMTWWGSGWTSSANTTPLVVLMNSCKFLARLEEIRVLHVVWDVTILLAAILTPFTIHHISDPWCVNHVETSMYKLHGRVHCVY